MVANDGTGKYKTVNEAVAAAPENSNSRYVIYVKKGVYKETIDIGKKKKNLMLVGDGKDVTIITGSLNVVDGSTTFRSATVGIKIIIFFSFVCVQYTTCSFTKNIYIYIYTICSNSFNHLCIKLLI